MVLSLIFYTEDNKLWRYTDQRPVQQIALKNIIDHLDPKLAIFYNFSNRAISNVYKNDKMADTTHMYNELLEIYH